MRRLQYSHFSLHSAFSSALSADQRVLNDLHRTMLSPRWLPPSPVKQVVSLSQSYCVPPVELSDARGGGEGLVEGRGAGGGSKSYDVENALSSINHSVLSAAIHGIQLNKRNRA